METNPQIIFSWVAPLRPYIKRSGRIIRFYLVLALLISLIVFFFGDPILIIPTLTLLFIFYVFTVTPPSDVTNKINQFGVETAGVNLRWEVLDHFFFSKRFGYEILTLVTHAPYSYHAYLVVPNAEIKKKVVEILSKHIIYQEEAKKTFTDRLIDWFSRLVPSEEEEPSRQPTPGASFPEARPQAP